MFHTALSFFLSRDKDNIRPNAAAKNGFLRPLLQRGFSSSSSSTECQSPPHISITILPNPAGTGKQTHFPYYEEETQSPTSSLSSSLRPSHPYIIHNPERTPSSPSVLQSRSSRHITILSDPAREKQRAMEWRSTQSNQNVSAAGTRVQTIKPKSILKPVPAPQPPTLGTDVKPSNSAVDAKARNLVVRVLLPRIVIHGPDSYEAETGVYLPVGTGTGTTNDGEMLGVPDVDSRSRLRQDDLARWYYPKKLAAEKIVHRLGSMVRRGSRIVFVRRRKLSRRYI